MDLNNRIKLSLRLPSRTPHAGLGPIPALEPESGGIGPLEPARTLFDRGSELGQKVQSAFTDAFVARTQPLAAVSTGLHTASMVAREAIPAFVASPAVGIVGAVAKLASSVGAPYAAKLSQQWVTESASAINLSPTCQALYSVVPRTAGLSLTLAALVSFPAAEAAALCVAVAGQAVQSVVEKRSVSRWKRYILAAACQTAVLLTREGIYSVSTRVTYTTAASPYNSSTLACNGATENCVAQWCDVVFPATHNSMMQPAPFTHLKWPFNDIGRFASNQARSVETQFADGIRGFLIEFYQNERGELRTSHNTVFDREPLSQTLQRFTTLLAAHPRDFVTLQLSQQQKGDYTSKLVGLFENSGLSQKTLKNACQSQPSDVLDAPACRLSMGSLLDLGVQVAVVRTPLQNRYDASTLAGLNCRVQGGATTPITKLIGDNASCRFTDSDNLCIDGQTDFLGAKIAPVTWNAFVSLALPSVSAVVNSYLPNFVANCANENLADVTTPTVLAVNHYESSGVVALAHSLNTQSYKRRGEVASCGVAMGIL